MGKDVAAPVVNRDGLDAEAVVLEAIVVDDLFADVDGGVVEAAGGTGGGSVGRGGGKDALPRVLVDTRQGVQGGGALGLDRHEARGGRWWWWWW